MCHLAWHEAIEQHRKTTNEGFSNRPWPCLSNDHVTGRHPFGHVVDKAFDCDLYSSHTLTHMSVVTMSEDKDSTAQQLAQEPALAMMHSGANYDQLLRHPCWTTVSTEIMA